MRRNVVGGILLLALLAAAAFVWPTRWRYDHIATGGDTYLVRIDRLSGHVDILVPEEGWVPSERRWDDFPPPSGQNS